MEDIRHFVFPSLPGDKKNNQPTGGSHTILVLLLVVCPLSAEQLSAVDDLITNMDLMEANV